MHRFRLGGIHDRRNVFRTARQVIHLAVSVRDVVRALASDTKGDVVGEVEGYSFGNMVDSIAVEDWYYNNRLQTC